MRSTTRSEVRISVHIVRFAASASADSLSPGGSVGVSDGRMITELAGVGGIGQLLRLSAAELRQRCGDAGGTRHEVAAVRVLPPVDGRMEVWAAGVTYRRSREARVIESERAADVYELVYDAERPELFFKSVAWKVSGDGGRISVREDSGIDVPEPELGLVLNAHGEIVG